MSEGTISTSRLEYVEGRESWHAEHGVWEDHLPHLAAQYRTMLRFAPDLAGSPLRVLDIGCAHGHLLRFLKLVNPSLDLWGVEIARRAADEAAAVVGADRVFWQGCGEPVPLPDASVDVVCSFDMIEHVPEGPELPRMVAEIARVLKPGGRTFVETPNYNRRMRALYRLTGQGHWLKYEHRNLFGGPKLRALLEPALTVDGVLHRGDWDPGSRVPLVRGVRSERLYLSMHICAVARKAG